MIQHILSRLFPLRLPEAVDPKVVNMAAWKQARQRGWQSHGD
jgi:hypothetical protein